MESCTVTLSANAGVSLEIDRTRIWIDALHSSKVSGFSTLSESLLESMFLNEHFIAPDFIIFTHCHPDHYSYELTRKAKNYWPRAKLILPEPWFQNQILITGKENSVADRGIHFRFVRLPHEGKQYATIPHYGCLINYRGFHILIAGDCSVANLALSNFLGNTHIDLALLDFPWITLPRGRRFIREYIQPESLLIYHLPFAEDDIHGYRQAASDGVCLLDASPDVRILQDAFQTENILLN